MISLGLSTFLWFYMILHMKSVFLSTVSIINIGMSIPVALFLYHFVFRISYFSLLHILAVIVILGIGNDNIFVLNDTFTQSGQIKFLSVDLDRRMAYTIRKSAKAMMITSLTTIVSFLATSFSNIMPISSFGIFAAIVVAVNYLIVILVMPPFIIIYEKYIKERFKCLCCKKIKKSAETNLSSFITK